MNSTDRVPATMSRSDTFEGFPEPDQHNILAHDLDRSMQACGDGMAASGAVPVIDIFAGPGGLGEGFSALRINGRSVFRIALSIEKDRDAHATLRCEASSGSSRSAGCRRSITGIFAANSPGKSCTPPSRPRRGARIRRPGARSWAPTTRRPIRCAAGPLK